MKRPIATWQVFVLFLVLLFTVGIYAMLAVVWQRVQERGQDAAASQPSYVVQILEPPEGTILQRAPEVAVRASLSEPGFSRAELVVDGVLISTQVNPQPQAAPWLAEWTWEGAGEGVHRLVVEGHRTDGSWQSSPPVMVSIVPPGRLAFASNRDGAQSIYVMESDGRGVERLVPGPGAARQPVWSGQGALAFVAEAEGGESTIHLLEDGTQRGQARALLPGRDPAWSPDGTRLAYAAGVDGASQIFVAAVGAGEGGAVARRQVTDEGAYAGQPAWSPDGRRLAYVARREGNWDVWVVALDGQSGAVRLTDDPAMDWAPAWSPDGTRLAFVSDRDGRHQVYTMRLDGSDVHALTSLDQGAEAPAWSPDGYWLAMVAYSGEGRGGDAREVYLLRADGQEMVRLTRNAVDDTDPAWAP